jgi:flagellar biogenesis protein FliO
MKLLLCLLCLYLLWLPSVALAKPGFELVDRGDAIEVIAHDVTAARTAVIPKRSRLEIELTGAPIIPPLAPTDASGDGVKVIELNGRTPRRLSVKVPMDRADVKRLARHARVFQVGANVHVLFPRAVPADGATVRLPEPTVAATAPIKSVKPIGPEKPEPAKPATAPTAPDAPDAPAASASKPAPAAPEVKPPAKESYLAKTEPSSDLPTYALLGLSAICIGAWFLKRKRATQVATSSIDVIAQRSLGAKAKVVWLAAGGREMVVAVTPQAVRMLGQWKKPNEVNGHANGHPNETEYALPSPLPTAHTHSEPRFARAQTYNPLPRAQTHHSLPRAPTHSSSVAGIMRLRAKTVAPPIEEIEPAYVKLDDDIATGDLDADALWAKEILAATSARR